MKRGAGVGTAPVVCSPVLWFSQHCAGVALGAKMSHRESAR